MTDVVKCYLGVDPGVVLLETLPLVVHHAHWQPDAVLVQTLVELPSEELNSHDGEDEPKHQADQQDVDDRGDGVHQGVYYDLQTLR